MPLDHKGIHVSSVDGRVRIEYRFSHGKAMMPYPYARHFSKDLVQAACKVDAKVPQYITEILLAGIRERLRYEDFVLLGLDIMGRFVTLEFRQVAGTLHLDPHVAAHLSVALTYHVYAGELLASKMDQASGAPQYETQH